jgi:putative aldouronate transport system substrate-binding protein
MDRRGFLRVGGVTAASAAVGALGACGGSSSESQNSDSTRTTLSAGSSPSSQRPKIALPDFVPYTGVKADLPATEAGADPGFLTFPVENPSLYARKPGASKEFSALITISLGTPPPLGKNKYWQALNAALGTQMNMVMATPSDYPAKFSATIASGDVPDVALLLMNTPKLPQVAEAEFEDLTDYVSGSAVRKYQALANITTQRWRSAIVNGRIRGVPQTRSAIRSIFTVRADICRQRGLDPVIKSSDDLLTLFRGLNDVKHGRWACDYPDEMVAYVLQMLEGPNVWREVNGVFESQFTSDEYRRALQFVAAMWKEGLFNPDAYTLSNAQLLSNIEGGKAFSTLYNNYGAYVVGNTVGTEYALTPSIPPKFAGGGTVPQFLTTGIYGLTVLKKASQSRIEELLRVVDWFTAPFGTKEYMLAQWGVEGWDYTKENGNLVKTSTGKTETSLQVAYIGYAPQPVYVAGFPDVTRAIYEYGKAVMPTAVLPANVGLYSATDSDKGPTLQKPLDDARRDVITGRKPLSGWDEAVRSWRKAGGDQIAQEYQLSWQQGNS